MSMLKVCRHDAAGFHLRPEAREPVGYASSAVFSLLLESVANVISVESITKTSISALVELILKLGPSGRRRRMPAGKWLANPTLIKVSSPNVQVNYLISFACYGYKDTCYKHQGGRG